MISIDFSRSFLRPMPPPHTPSAISARAQVNLIIKLCHKIGGYKDLQPAAAQSRRHTHTHKLQHVRRRGVRFSFTFALFFCWLQHHNKI